MDVIDEQSKKTKVKKEKMDLNRYWKLVKIIQRKEETPELLKTYITFIKYD